MLKIFLAVLMIAHGLVHGSLAIAPNPADPEASPGTFFTAVERSWLLAKLGWGAPAVRWLGIALVILSTVGFILAGLGVWGPAGLTSLWRTAAVVASLLSLLLLILFWHRWLPVGVLIDIGILIALLWANWPTQILTGS